MDELDELKTLVDRLAHPRRIDLAILATGLIAAIAAVVTQSCLASFSRPWHPDSTLCYPHVFRQSKVRLNLVGHYPSADPGTSKLAFIAVVPQFDFKY